MTPTIERGAAVVFARQPLGRASSAPRVTIAKTDQFSLALVDHMTRGGCPISVGSCQLFSRLIDGRYSAPAAFQTRYSTLSGGVARVYATRDDGSGIDVIDRTGATTPLLESPDTTILPETQIVETSAGLFAWTARQGTVHVSEVTVSPWDGALRLTGETSHPIALLGGIGGRHPAASTARRVRAGKELPIWAPAIQLPVLDVDGAATDAWMLVATEVHPPPAGTKRTRKAEYAAGCGAISRPLSDPSVEKRVHLLTFHRTRWTEDRDVAALLPPGYERPTTALALSDGRVELDGVVIDKLTAQGTAHVAQPPFVPGSQCVRRPEWTLDALVWDEPSREGIVTWHVDADGRRQGRALRVDAAGRALGAPTTTRWSYQPTLTRVGGHWMSLESTGASWLTGPDTGRRVAWPRNGIIGAVGGGDAATVFVGDFRRIGVFTLTGSAPSPVRWLREARARFAERALLVDGVPSLVIADDDGAVALRADGSERQLRDNPHATPRLGPVSLEPTFGGVVLARLVEATTEWLLRDRRPEPTPHFQRGNNRQHDALSFRSTPPTLFPSEPGVSFPLPADCGVAVPTGPDAWLAVCVVPASDNPDALSATSLALVPLRGRSE